MRTGCTRAEAGGFVFIMDQQGSRVRVAQLSDYEVLEVIGTGTFGTCEKIRRKSDQQLFVWKRIRYGEMNDKEKHMLVAEVNILRELKHDHIVRYHDRVIDRENSTIYIIMEYCPGGDLAALIKTHRRQRTRASEQLIRRIFRQLVEALGVCHHRAQGAIIHRDLKPGNIFLDQNGNAKLGDFGLSKVLSARTNLASTFVGSPYYMSPELISECAYTAKSDVWSLGCIIYELAALHPPFEAWSQAELAVKIRKGTFEHLPTTYSRELDDLVRSMLQQDYHLRPSVLELRKHPYLAYAQASPDVRAMPSTPPAEQHRPVARRGQARRLPSTTSSDHDSSGSGAECRRCDRLARLEEELAQRQAALDAREQLLDARLRALDQRERQLQLFTKQHAAFGKENEAPALRKIRTPFAPGGSPRERVVYNVYSEIGAPWPQAGTP
ncbi:uncharacterized protein MONBRDRAFT_25342 [Monosiga brevicollis MX1]|uniref:non-specific serine/threonine protein kinase n=1 Tax=Monosiga brevicollis TaxID=81824 RepID=A9UZ49_MONBE|nr:uncharacterized protein MONBRDRAFT_25342 [Monosiga brevicollis MX1]EDQ89571.1 predicted protein [Monosiga brevicollis MX1]|eukprot:XP_001745600.1 hypothetical protein [Monosiga brevicollis MX1]